MSGVPAGALVYELTHDHAGKLAARDDLAVEMTDMELIAHRPVYETLKDCRRKQPDLIIQC